MTPIEFQKKTHVSRETLGSLETYANLLETWNQRLNLVSPSTINDLWLRHFLDSYQLVQHLPENTKRIADLGAGAGFPGLVVAISSSCHVDLIESDQRKSSFLRQMKIATELSNAEIITARCETITQTYDLITARAFAPIGKIFQFTAKMRSEQTQYLLLKGRNAQAELTEAQAKWDFTYRKIPSITAADSCLIQIERVSPRHD